MTITIDSSGNVSPGLTIPVLNATTFNITGQITSTLVTGTAPLVVASTTQVANLNASFLVGGTWAAPGAIGTTTPASGAFAGVLSVSAYGGAYTDGIVADYVTGNGRLSVGAADTLSIYNGGVGTTLLAQIGAAGLALSVPLEFQSGTISAAGTNQGTATLIVADNTYVTAGTGGAILPTAVVGREISVTNNTAASIVVYPATGANIENAAVNVGVTVPAYATIGLVAKSTTNWWTIQPVYNAGSNITITQSANGTVTWALPASIALTGQTSTGAFATTGKAVVNNNASATYTFAANQGYVAFTGTQVASLTINFPAAAAGIDGLEVEVYTQAAVGTAVTFASTGATFVGAPATLAAGSLTKFIFNSATNQWLPRG